MSMNSESCVGNESDLGLVVFNHSLQFEPFVLETLREADLRLQGDY